MRFYRLVIISLLLLASPFSLAEIYKWVDAQGKIHFSESAPENESTEIMDEKLQDTGNFLDYPDIPFDDTLNIEETPPEAATPGEALEIHIELIDYQLSEETLENIHNNINAMYYAYQQWFGWPAQAQYPINIKLFGSLKPFEDYQRLKNYPLRNRSFYSGTPNREIVMKGVLESEILITLYHEVSHAILNMQQANSSKWLNEGLAEMFSNNTGIDDDLPVLATDEKWVYIIKMMLANNSLDDISSYLAIPNQQWRDSSRLEENSYYMIAWSIMYFMSTHEESRETLKAVFAINRNQALHGENLIRIIDQHYAGGIEKLNSDWRTWLSNIE